MAGKKRRLRIIDFEVKREKIRYGRATLTVECRASVGFTPVARVLADYRQGEETAEEVAWTFLRSQVVRHSPTFDWDRADLAVLLPRVTKVITEPNLKATTPDELISELEEIEQRDQERWSKSQTLAKRWSDFVVKTDMNHLLVGEMKKLTPRFDQMFRNYVMHVADWSEITPKFRTQEVLLDTNLLEGVKLASGSLELGKAVSERFAPMLQGRMGEFDWVTIASGFSEAAKANQFMEPAEAVEATVEAAERSDSSNMDALLEGLQPMFENLEKALKQAKDSTTRMLLVAIAAGLIVLMIQSTLARMGVPITVPEQPTKVEHKKSKKAKSSSKAKPKRGKAPQEKRSAK